MDKRVRIVKRYRPGAPGRIALPGRGPGDYTGLSTPSHDGRRRAERPNWDGRDASGARVAAGIYWVALQMEGRLW